MKNLWHFSKKKTFKNKLKNRYVWYKSGFRFKIQSFLGHCTLQIAKKSVDNYDEVMVEVRFSTF